MKETEIGSFENIGLLSRDLNFALETFMKYIFICNRRRIYFSYQAKKEQP